VAYKKGAQLQVSCIPLSLSTITLLALSLILLVYLRSYTCILLPYHALSTLQLVIIVGNMRSIIPLVIIAGLAVATPTPLSPSVRQNAYDVAIDASDYANEHPGCGSLLEDGCNPLRLQATELLTGDSESGLLGANTQIAGLHLRHVKRDGLLGGITNIK
jgi:hypothetical protein